MDKIEKSEGKTIKISEFNHKVIENMLPTIRAKLVTNDRKTVSKKTIADQFIRSSIEHFDTVGGTMIYTQKGPVYITKDDLN